MARHGNRYPPSVSIAATATRESGGISKKISGGGTIADGLELAPT
jgi:hypothetical protein